MIQRLQEKRNEEGFTLIELLIVIIVLGILAAIVVFAVGSTKDDAVKSACNTSVKSVELSAEAVNTHESDYPAGPLNQETALASNFVVAGNSADNGALLKTFPESNDYILQYRSIGSPVTDYAVDVYPKGKFVNASGVWNNADFTGAATALPGGCSDLS